FAYPDRLWQALQTHPPDVLMLTNYLWNEALSLRFASLAKKLNPGTLVVMGGPNIPIEASRQIQYFNQHPDIDVYVLGEGDFLATEVVRQFLAAGNSVRRLGEGTLPSSIYRRPDGETVMNTTWDRKSEVGEIPSPWLTGIQDEFFDGKLAPM